MPRKTATSQKVVSRKHRSRDAAWARATVDRLAAVYDARKRRGKDELPQTLNASEGLPPTSRSAIKSIGETHDRAVVQKLARRHTRDNKKLPSRKAFKKYIRDSVKAGEPLPKILNLGITWGNAEKHDWQPYDQTQDAARTAVRRVADRRRRTRDIDGAENTLQMGTPGETMSGWGVPMSGPDTSMPSRMYSKGNAQDAIKRFLNTRDLHPLVAAVAQRAGGAKPQAPAARPMQPAARPMQAPASGNFPGAGAGGHGLAKIEKTTSTIYHMQPPPKPPSISTAIPSAGR